MKKQSRFRCETCGRDVPYDSSACPHCGVEFEAVRCPQCSYQGPPGEFADGCPRCGYMASSRPVSRKSGGKRRKPQGAGAPLWIYAAILGGLLILLLILLEISR